jgi:single-strand DNA-binding protein
LRDRGQAPFKQKTGPCRAFGFHACGAEPPIFRLIASRPGPAVSYRNAQREESIMRSFAEYQILGRVGKRADAGTALKISIAAEYGRRDDRGDFQTNPFWNTVTLFREQTIAWVRANIQPGDLVLARGTLRETSWDKDGETRYGVTLAAEEFTLLAKKRAAPDAGDAPDNTD